MFPWATSLALRGETMTIDRDEILRDSHQILDRLDAQTMERQQRSVLLRDELATMGDGALGIVLDGLRVMVAPGEA